MSRDARLSILTAQEVDELYRLPRFIESDRGVYFDLSPAERKLVDDVATLSVAAHLVLQLGYFKAKRQFFVYGLTAVADDLEHILRCYFPARAFGQTFLTSAGLSNESVKYYGSLVQFYTVYKLQRMAVPTVRLYLLCFASHRYRQINDNLIEAFIHLVDDYEQQAKIAAEIAAAESMAEATGNLQAAGQVLNLFLDPAIADSTPLLEGQTTGVRPARCRTLRSGLWVYAKDRVRQDLVRMVVLRHATRQV